MSTITITGGAHSGFVHSALTPAEALLASTALYGTDFAAVDVLAGGVDVRLTNSSPVSAIVLDNIGGTAASKLASDKANSILVGNQGADKFTLAKNGTVIGGNGRDTVSIHGTTGTSSVNLGNGNDVVHVRDGGQIVVGNGADSISVRGTASIKAGNGNDTIHLASGTVTVGRGHNVIKATGHDTITLGSGNDTVTESGSATVTGAFGSASISNGRLVVKSGAHHAHDTVIASGTGVTIQGINKEVLQVTSGTAVLTGGRNDTFIGGSGASTMTGGGGHNLYEFHKSTPGGVAVINNFVQGHDQLQLQGYNVTHVLGSDISQSGGNTYINLGGGTSIELKGFTGTLHPSDFKH